MLATDSHLKELLNKYIINKSGKYSSDKLSRFFIHNVYDAAKLTGSGFTKIHLYDAYTEQCKHMLL